MKKKYKVTYYRGSDILIDEITAMDMEQALYIFNMRYMGIADIKSIEVIEDAS